MTTQHGNFINGSFVESKGQEQIPALSPATDAVLSEIPETLPEAEADALAAAKAAQKTWDARPTIERDGFLHRIATRIRESVPALAKNIVAEQGKVVGLAEVEADFIADYLNHMAERARRLGPPRRKLLLLSENSPKMLKRNSQSRAANSFRGHGRRTGEKSRPVGRLRRPCGSSRTIRRATCRCFAARSSFAPRCRRDAPRRRSCRGRSSSTSSSAAFSRASAPPRTSGGTGLRPRTSCRSASAARRLLPFSRTYGSALMKTIFEIRTFPAEPGDRGGFLRAVLL